MPVINVTVSKLITREQKEKLIFDLTSRTYESLNIPPEKISVVINELPIDNIGRGGYTENHPYFDEVSRKLSM